jgi:hypothetical protein
MTIVYLPEGGNFESQGQRHRFVELRRYIDRQHSDGSGIFNVKITTYQILATISPSDLQEVVNSPLINWSNFPTIEFVFCTSIA